MELPLNLPHSVSNERTVMNRCSHMESGGITTICHSCLLDVLALPEPKDNLQESGKYKVPEG